jgi:hypothetical protein
VVPIPEELRPDVVVAALALDRFGDERGDVVRMCLEGSFRLRVSTILSRLDLDEMIFQREGDRRHVDPRPVELGEPGGLDRLGVGQRHGVAAAAVERSPQVHDLGPELGGAAGRLVLPALPVEGDLEGVLHRERATLDEEQVWQRRITDHPGEGLDELRVLTGVDVGVGRLVGRRLGELGHERRVVDDAGRVQAQRRRGEEGVEIQVAQARPGVDQPRPTAALQVQDELHPVGEHVAGQRTVDLVGTDLNPFSHPASPQVGRERLVVGIRFRRS